MPSQGLFHFVMAQPIPSYLIALAVGDLAFQPLGKRTGVWAEPSVVKAAAYEFADVEKMVESAEKQFGPLSLGPLRHLGPAPELSVRRDGEPPADLRHPDGAGGRPIAGLVGRP